MKRSKRKRLKEVSLLKSKEPIVFEVLAMFYGFAGWGACHHYPTIAKRLEIITPNEAHALKWYGMHFLGWSDKEDVYYQKQGERALFDIEKCQLKRKGEKKMTPQEEFAKVKAALILKRESDNDFGSLLEKIELVYIKKKRVKIYFKGIFTKIIGGESLVDIANSWGLSETFVITVAGLIFCLAYPDNMSEARQESKVLYGELISAYKKHLSARIEAEKLQVGPSVITEEESEMEDTIHEKWHSSILVPVDFSAIEGENIEDSVVGVVLKIEAQPPSVIFESGWRGDIRYLSSVLTNDEIILINDSLRPGTKIVRQREGDPEKGTCYLLRTWNP